MVGLYQLMMVNGDLMINDRLKINSKMVYGGLWLLMIDSG
jgi:hypothetical protein